MRIYVVKKDNQVVFSTLKEEEAEDVRTAIFAETGKMPELVGVERAPTDHRQR